MCLLSCLLGVPIILFAIFVAFPTWCAYPVSYPLLSLRLSPTDYELVGPPQVVLSAGAGKESDDSHKASFSINITQDNLLELAMFSSILSTTDESVKIKHEKYRVVIINMDMDGMYRSSGSRRRHTCTCSVCVLTSYPNIFCPVPSAYHIYSVYDGVFSLVPTAVDVVVGDPVFYVPLFLSESSELEGPLGLCFQIHGEDKDSYNLLTTPCTSVNGLWTAVTNTLNVITEISASTVSDDGCHTSNVQLESCIYRCD